MRAEIDRAVCAGHALCNSHVPEVFELDDDGIASVVADEISADLEDRVHGAMLRCPTGAITLETR
jgi:ferredoxin